MLLAAQPYPYAMPWRVATTALAFVVVACGSSTATPPPTPAPTTEATAVATAQATAEPTFGPGATATQGSGQGAHPPACGDATFVDDGERLLLVTCVNQTSGQAAEQIWEYSESGWSLVSDDGPPPVVVTGAAWDEGRGVLVRYGGLPMGSNDCVAETWEWDGASWARKTTAEDLHPPACDHEKLAYDADAGYTLLFGGGDDETNLTAGTFAWDGADWLDVGEEGPIGRAHHGLVYDPIHAQTLLYGGYDGVSVFDDLWSLQGATWTELDIPGPGARSHHGLAISTNAELLLFGGATGPNSFDTMSNATWLLTDGRWLQVAAEGPSARLSPALGFDPRRERWVLYGGFGFGGGELADTWEFHDSTWDCIDVC